MSWAHPPPKNLYTLGRARRKATSAGQGTSLIAPSRSTPKAAICTLVYPGVVDVFSPDLVIPDVTTEPVTSFMIEPSTKMWTTELQGTVNPAFSRNT